MSIINYTGLGDLARFISHLLYVLLKPTVTISQPRQR